MRKNTVLLLTILFGLSSLLFGSNPAFAVTEPTFPSCINPQGTLKENYSSGTHGVPGDSTNYTGSDSVYYLTDNTLMQCLCPDNGQGIQTNWWKALGFTEAEIDVQKRNGWIYVPNGAVWGLENAPYLAKNIAYTCRGRTNTAGTSSQILGLASTGNLETIYLNALIGLWLVVVGLSIRHYVKNRSK